MRVLAVGKAVFIVLEGIDGCGKSTQIARLSASLAARGRNVAVTAEPTNSPAGKRLRAALSGKEPVSDSELALLFTYDRLGHNLAPDGIKALLASGKDVISDRYYYSTLAYQGSVTDFEWVRAMNCDCPDIRRPDLCVFLDLSPDAALARIGARGEKTEIFEKRDTLTLVRNTFFSVFDRLSDRVAVVDAEGTPDEVAARVLAAVLPIL